MAVGVIYFIGFFLHALDVMSLRLNFSEIDFLWKSWILFLLIFDLIASAGLILKKFWGEIAFIMVALAQLTAYLGFSSVFNSGLSAGATGLLIMAGAAASSFAG